jgi:hypothetical protein
LGFPRYFHGDKAAPIRLSSDRIASTAISQPRQGHIMIRIVSAKPDAISTALAHLNSVSSATTPLPTSPEHETLKLLIWEDKGEVQFRYGPTDNVVFKQPGTDKTLEVELVAADNTPENRAFWLSHYTTSRVSFIKNVDCWLKHRDAQHNIVEKPVSLQNFKNSTLGEKVTRIQFQLDMQPGESFYLNLIAKYKNGGERFISCDPQVENGSKT